MSDLIGTALQDYYAGKYTTDIITSTSISDEDILPLPYLFRDFKTMPQLEQRALHKAKGTVLDVGCGAGNHCLWLQEQGVTVKGIDTSEGAIAVSEKRGVINAKQHNLLKEVETFDTVLILMNGTGIFKTLSDAPTYLEHLKSILNPNGQILIDSTDIAYMYDEDDSTETYYGELDYFMTYKGMAESTTWLYLDPDSFAYLANQSGLTFECIAKGESHDYLARLTAL